MELCHVFFLSFLSVFMIINPTRTSWKYQYQRVMWWRWLSWARRRSRLPGVQASEEKPGSWWQREFRDFKGKRTRYLIYGWEDYPVEEIIIQIHFDIWNVGEVWPPIWRRVSHPFAVMWCKCCFYLWGFFFQWGQSLCSLGNCGHLPAGPAQNNTARLGLVERATDESNPPGPLTETNQEESRP